MKKMPLPRISLTFLHRFVGLFKKSPKIILILFFGFVFFKSEKANAVNVVITGSTNVCPGKTITYTANAYQIPFGWEVHSCQIVWTVYKGLEIVGGGYGTTFTFQFPDVGLYEVKAAAGGCAYFHADGEKIISVNSRVVVPSPVFGPAMCFSGQSYTYETIQPLHVLNPYGSECYYHYPYLWTAPTGWSINGGGNSAFASDTVSIMAPAGTPAGSYNVSVQALIERPGPSEWWYSAPRQFSVQVGPFSSSQVTVSGAGMVCNGSSYTYTANVPTGHQNGYTYSWTYPSGWSVESTSQNTIRLHVPSNNNSYGAVRVSINNGCGTTPLTGITVFPCNNYMMTSGDFAIYPNPTFEEVNVEYLMENSGSFKANSTNEPDRPSSLTFKVEVYNGSEKLVLCGESIENKVHFDTKNLQPGTYFLHIISGKEVIRKQIIFR